MKFVKFIVALSLLGTHAAYASTPQCPPPSEVKKEYTRAGTNWFRYYVISVDGRKLMSGKEFSFHPCCYIFINHRVDSLNVELSKYDEQSKQLTCAYNIHTTDAATDYDWGYEVDLLKSNSGDVHV